MINKIESKNCKSCTYKLKDITDSPCNICFINTETHAKSVETEYKCEYCKGHDSKRQKLMENINQDYFVIINACNYLEDSVIGNSCDHSLFGIKINYCPMCGGKL